MASLKRFWTMSLACAGLILCGQAAAQAPPGGGATRTDVSSDRLTRYDAEHRAVYSGAVEVVQDGGRTRLTCDTLTIYFYGPGEGPNASAKAPAPAPGGSGEADAGSGNIKQMVADGHVFYVTQNETARGDHGVYDAEPDVVTLTGGVIVVQGKNVLRGDKMVMDRKSGQTTVVSNATGRNNPNRVRSVIYNDNAQNGQGQPGQGQGAKPPPAPAKKP